MFFYCLVFDPAQKTLLADRGEIRVGSRYQAEATALLKEGVFFFNFVKFNFFFWLKGEEDTRNSEDLETLVWTPSHNLTDRQIDQFLVISRSVGTFARALDCSSSVKQPSLHMSAAAASRDVTLVIISNIARDYLVLSLCKLFLTLATMFRLSIEFRAKFQKNSFFLVSCDAYVAQSGIQYIRGD